MLANPCAMTRNHRGRLECPFTAHSIPGKRIDASSLSCSPQGTTYISDQSSWLSIILLCNAASSKIPSNVRRQRKMSRDTAILHNTLRCQQLAVSKFRLVAPPSLEFSNVLLVTKCWKYVLNVNFIISTTDFIQHSATWTTRVVTMFTVPTHIWDIWKYERCID